MIRKTSWMKLPAHQKLSIQAAAMLLWATPLPAELLDDTSIYIGPAPTVDSAAPPNFMLLFDTSSEMGDPVRADELPRHGGTGGGTPGSAIASQYSEAVDEGEVVPHGPFPAAGGTSFRANMTGNGNADLYVRQGVPPGPDEFDCRSVSAGSAEDCLLQVSTDGLIYVSVLGSDTERPSEYQLRVTYTPVTMPTHPISNQHDCSCDQDAEFHCGFTNAFVNTGSTRTICRDKLSVMQSAATRFIEELQTGRVGLMRFRDDAGGYLVHDVTDIHAGSTRADLTRVIGELDYTGNSPFSGALYETWRYMAGQPELAGFVEGATDPGVFIDDSAFDGATYDSPVDRQCQATHVVMLSGSLPDNSEQAAPGINALPGVRCGIGDRNTGGIGVSCLQALAGYMSSTDPVSALADGSLSIHTIGLGLSEDAARLFGNVAQSGSGLAFSFQDAGGLATALTDISRFATDSSMLSAPAVVADTFNKFRHREHLYYAVFRPSTSTRWTGNFKKYLLSPAAEVLDMQGIPAIDEITGNFSGTARSFWSLSTDGNEISRGGFRDRIPAIRTIFTSTAAGQALLKPASVDAADLELPLGYGESGYTAADEELADKIARWAQGADLFGTLSAEGNRFVGDPVHTRPIIVNYGCRLPRTDGSCPEDQIDETLFGTTNPGFLHAIDAGTGNEHFSFIPRELLKNLPAYAVPALYGPGKFYGLDGPLTVLRIENEGDADQDIEPAEGDTVLLYAAMRRGGSSYYAFDVSDRMTPRLAWQINGGIPTTDIDSPDVDQMTELAATADHGFEDLGQTWSAARLAGINWNCDSGGEDCERRAVLVFSGGYDPRHDENSIVDPSDPLLDNQFGNAIYMVDAATGELLWSAGNNEDSRSRRPHDLHLGIVHSIPASPGLLDADGDGALDIIIVADITGGIWRVDINSTSRGAADLATGGMIFDLAEEGVFRRFYNRPDVVLNTPRGEPAYIALVLGSGYRANPGSLTQSDQIYVLFEDSPFAAPADDNGDGDAYSNGLVTANRLYRLHIRPDADDKAITADRKLNAPNGYVIALTGPGEKVLQPALTLNNVAIITSYLPPPHTEGIPSSSTCPGKPRGSGRVYVIDVRSGRSMLGAGPLSLEQSGIPPEPAVVFSAAPSGGAIPVICIGTECFGYGDILSDALGPLGKIHRSYWRENSGVGVFSAP